MIVLTISLVCYFVPGHAIDYLMVVLLDGLMVVFPASWVLINLQGLEKINLIKRPQQSNHLTIKPSFFPLREIKLIYTVLPWLKIHGDCSHPAFEISLLYRNGS